MHKISVESLQKTFLSTLEADRAKHIQRWMVDWAYQKKRSRGGASYDTGVINEFFSFTGVEDLVKWMNWFNPHYPDYFPAALTAPLVEKSKNLDRQILGAYGLNYDFEKNYDHRVGINNAHDYLLTNLYPVPERNKINTVLDFGAGYGRNANLWSQMLPGVVFIGMDAIPNSYCLQHLYYSKLGIPFSDYIENPATFGLDTNKSGCYHIPTWRADLIPDNSVDLIKCVQVLPELSGKVVRHMISVFNRILKPGGMLYIRDHSEIWKPVHKINVDSYLVQNGFELEYRGYLILDGDLHGIPRIFRKTDPKVKQSVTYTMGHRKKQLLFDLRSIAKKLKRK